MTEKSKAGRPRTDIPGHFYTRRDGRRTPLYNKWMSMHARCYQRSHPAFDWYGGKGVTVCPAWHGSAGFQQFCMDMGDPNGLTLERKDSAQPYSKDNCRWATWKEQAANRGPTGTPKDPLSLAGRCRAAGLDYTFIYQRIRAGWTEHDAFTIRKL